MFMNVIQKVLARIIHVTKLLGIGYFRFATFKPGRVWNQVVYFGFYYYRRRKLQFTCKEPIFYFYVCYLLYFPEN